MCVAKEKKTCHPPSSDLGRAFKGYKDRKVDDQDYGHGNDL